MPSEGGRHIKYLSLIKIKIQKVIFPMSRIFIFHVLLQNRIAAQNQINRRARLIMLLIDKIKRKSCRVKQVPVV
jgi:hypothetical protein